MKAFVLKGIVFVISCYITIYSFALKGDDENGLKCVVQCSGGGSIESTCPGAVKCLAKFDAIACVYADGNLVIVANCEET